MENLEQMIIYFPRAAKFYTFGNTLEENVVTGKIFDILQNDEIAKKKVIDFYEYGYAKHYYDAHHPQVQNIKENK